LRGLRKRFPNGTIAVDGIDLDVAEGELVALLGPSGCGKTTTLRCIAGFEDPDQGAIELDGQRIDTLPPNRRGATMVFQGYALFPHLTVFENVAYGLRVRRLRGDLLRERVDSALTLVDLAGYGDRRPQQLSGGQQQRVALARALVLEPKLLLFDEPLSNLDAKLREQMRLEIRSLQQRVGITSVYVTHDQVEAMTLADRIAVMDRGRIVQLGTPREIYDEPATRFVADFVGRANFVRGTVVSCDTDGLIVQTLGSVCHGRAASGPVRPGDAVDVLIRPEDLEIVPSAVEGALPATVVLSSFAGGQVAYQLQCTDQSLFATAPSTRGAPLPQPGAMVGVRISPYALRVFLAEPSPPNSAEPLSSA
jgi:iron(III) transport system ATP-binding protein